MKKTRGFIDISFWSYNRTLADRRKIKRVDSFFFFHDFPFVFCCIEASLEEKERGVCVRAGGFLAHTIFVRCLCKIFFECHSVPFFFLRKFVSCLILYKVRFKKMLLRFIT